MVVVHEARERYDTTAINRLHALTEAIKDWY